jgi:hypothetical protein
MSSKVTVNGRITSIPGVYTSILSGVKNPPTPTSYGNICLFDLGAGLGYIGGSGIAGAKKSGLDSVYEFSSLEDFRAVVRGGEYWSLGEKLFQPNSSNSRGASKVFLVKACESTAASTTLALSAVSVGLSTKDEGTVANGVLVSSELKKGYAIKIRASPFVEDAYIIYFYLGTYKGLDAQGGSLGNIPRDGVSEADSKPKLLFQTPPINNMEQFKKWALQNTDFSAMFDCSFPDTDLSTQITSLEITTFGTAYKLFASGTETYNSDHFSTVLDVISNLDNSIFIAPDHGEDAASADNAKLLYHINNEARFEKIMVVGAGIDASEFRGTVTASTEIAKYFDSERVIVVHGGYKEKSGKYNTLLNRSSLFSAAIVAGRTSGLEPQIPLTFKRINVAGLNHNLSRDEKEFALDCGVMYLDKDPDLSFVIGAGINSIQRNIFLVNNDASTYSVSVSRIKAQLNKELTVNAKLDFFGSEVGANRGTFTEEDIKTWAYKFLSTKLAQPNQDNIIIRIGNISASFTGDTCYLTYEFVPNFEIQKVLITGVLLEK